jgi:hypothetical protein
MTDGNDVSAATLDNRAVPMFSPTDVRIPATPQAKKNISLPPQAPVKPGEEEEMKTINMIETLPQMSKKLLNTLVQSVIKSQHDLEREKLDVLALRMNLLNTKKKLEQANLEVQK